MSRQCLANVLVFLEGWRLLAFSWLVRRSAADPRKYPGTTATPGVQRPLDGTFGLERDEAAAALSPTLHW